jgi:hypothetical protein
VLRLNSFGRGSSRLVIYHTEWSWWGLRENNAAWIFALDETFVCWYAIFTFDLCGSKFVRDNFSITYTYGIPFKARACKQS